MKTDGERGDGGRGVRARGKEEDHANATWGPWCPEAGDCESWSSWAGAGVLDRWPVAGVCTGVSRLPGVASRLPCCLRPLPLPLLGGYIGSTIRAGGGSVSLPPLLQSP